MGPTREEIQEIMSWGNDREQAHSIYYQSLSYGGDPMERLRVVQNAAKAWGIVKDEIMIIADKIGRAFGIVFKSVSAAVKDLYKVADLVDTKDKRQRLLSYKKKKSQAKNWSKWKKKRR